MELETKHARERAKWDRLAARKVAPDELVPPGVGFLEDGEDDENMSYVVDEVAAFLGDLRGARLLELGCGRGAYAVLLARCGATVSAIDLSSSAIATTKERAALTGVALEALVAPGEQLPFEDETFDIAFGTAALHHMEVNRAGPELWRVLKPGGRAVFLEPMGMNPLLRFARDHLPYRHKTPRGEDRPLDYNDIEAWGRGFSRFWFKECQLFSMIERAFGFDRRFPRLRRIDAAILERYPAARRWARLVAMFGVK